LGETVAAAQLKLTEPAEVVAASPVGAFGAAVQDCGEVPPPDDEVLPPDDEVLPPDDEVLPPDDEVLPPDDEVLPPDDEVLPPDDEVLPPDDEVLPPDDEVLPPVEVVEPEVDPGDSPEEEFPPHPANARLARSAIPTDARFNIRIALTH
jgi:hypothetical protein